MLRNTSPIHAEQIGFSENGSDRTCFSEAPGDATCAYDEWQGDELFRDVSTPCVDEDIWHVQSGGFNFDAPDSSFQAQDETPREDAMLEPEVKRPRHDEQLVPTFMGDAGFDSSHIDAWRSAEAIVGIVNAAAKSPKNKKVSPPLRGRSSATITRAMLKAMFSSSVTTA